MEVSSVVRLRYGVRHPLFWIWAAVSVLLGGIWFAGGGGSSLAVWQQAVVPAALVVGLLWAQVCVTPLDTWLKRHPAPVLVLASVVSFLQMEISTGNPFSSMIFLGYVWGVLIALAVYLVLYAVLGRVWMAGTAAGAVFLIWGLGSYYTLFFRGLPLMPNDLMSVGTAANVLGNYTLELTQEVVAIVALFVCQLQIFLALRHPRARRRWQTALAARLGCGAAGVLWLWLFCAGPLVPGRFHLYEWSWQENCYYQGYLETVMLRLEKLFIKPPAGYSEQQVKKMAEEMEPDLSASDDVQPDVILIINESWFDWNQLTDFETNRPVTPFLDSLDNCVRGFAVNPNLSTSGAVYEVLTSNCTALMPSLTPFTQMNLSGTNSLVKHLAQLGYSSASFHPASYANYNRKSVYPNLGFETSWFWNWEEENPMYAQLQDAMFVHNGLSDKSCFDYVIEMYEERDTSRPAFLYNLTYQNHGGYEQATFNGGSWEVDAEHRVRVTDGFDEVRGQAEEYLSCLTYTDDAFAGLIDYFAQQEDPVVICMVGDHIPHFTGDVESDYSGLEYQMRSRGTPFVIWANYPLQEGNVGYIDMSQLAPLLLETAEIPLSPFYQSLAELSRTAPVITRDFYRLSTGDFATYLFTEMPEEDPLLRRYLYFENYLVHCRGNDMYGLSVPYADTAELGDLSA